MFRSCSNTLPCAISTSPSSACLPCVAQVNFDAAPAGYLSGRVSLKLFVKDRMNQKALIMIENVEKATPYMSMVMYPLLSFSLSPFFPHD